MAAVYVFITSAQSGALGALMTFSPHVWYPIYETTTRAWGLNPIEDQRLAGLIMWVPAGLIFLVLGLALFAGSLSEAGRRVALAESELRRKERNDAACSSHGAPSSPLWPAAGRRSRPSTAMPIGGGQLVTKYGCDTCHVIPGVKGTQGMVGPSLQHIASRQIIASKFPNSPQTMMRWIQNPQSFDPQTSMPNMSVTPADARDITAYLFTLK